MTTKMVNRTAKTILIMTTELSRLGYGGCMGGMSTPVNEHDKLSLHVIIYYFIVILFYFLSRLIRLDIIYLNARALLKKGTFETKCNSHNLIISTIIIIYNNCRR